MQMGRLLVVWGDEAKEYRLAGEVDLDSLTEADARNILREANDSGTIQDTVLGTNLPAGEITNNFITNSKLEFMTQEQGGRTALLRPKVAFGR